MSNSELKLYIPVVVAVVSAILAFIFTRVQKWFEFRNIRRSIAITVFVEIKEVLNSTLNANINWNELKQKVTDVNYKPMLIISSDVKILARIEIESYQFPNQIIADITKFKNSIDELYASMNAVNLEQYNQLASTTRVRIVDLILQLSDKVHQNAKNALSTMQQKLPPQWLKGL